MPEGYHDFSAGEYVTAANLESYCELQGIMRFASAAARDTALSAVKTEGMFAYLLDVNSVTVYNGSAWSTLGPVHGAWTAYTPTWSGTIGNGAILGAYQRDGRAIRFRASVNWGSSTTHAASAQTLSLPVAAAGWYTTYGPIGSTNCADFSAGPTHYLGPVMVIAGSTTTVSAFALTNWGGATPVGFPTNLVPFTWAVNDNWFVIGSYEAAADA